MVSQPVQTGYQPRPASVTTRSIAGRYAKVVGGDPKPDIVRVVRVVVVAVGDTRIVLIVVPRPAAQPPFDLSPRYQACACKRHFA